MKTLAYFIGALHGIAGIVSLIAATQGNAGRRILIGLTLIAAGLLIAYITRMKVPDQRIIQEIDLSGDVHAEEMTCNNCGAPLDRDSIALREGAVFVDCPYCGTSYQIEEEPKW